MSAKCLAWGQWSWNGENHDGDSNGNEVNEDTDKMVMVVLPMALVRMQT
jgi:hypothetical protein